MRNMLACDLACLKGLWKGTVGIAVVTALVIGTGMGSLGAVLPCVICAVSLSMLISLLTYDEAGGWQAYRATMPLTRNQIVSGRFVSGLVIVGFNVMIGVVVCLVMYLVALLCARSGTLGFIAVLAEGEGADPLVMAIGAVVSIASVLIMMGFILPLVMKTGLTNAVRLLPLVFVAIAIFASLGVKSAAARGIGSPFFTWAQTTSGIAALTIIICVIAAVFYIGACFVARRLYAKREL